MPQHDWRGIVSIEDYLSDHPDDVWRETIEEPIGYEKGDPIVLPDICLIFMPDDSEPPAWTARLQEKIRQHMPQAYQVWIIAAGEVDMRGFNVMLHQPEKNSFVLNIFYPQGFPNWKSNIGAEKFLDLMSKYGSSNYYLSFITWLENIIG
jgi:hypothetical protein